MSFAGESTTIRLDEVFDNVGFNGLTGVLAVRTDEREAHVYFRQGRIRALAGSHAGFDYVSIADRAHAAPPDILRAAARRLARRRRTLKSILRQAQSFDEVRFDAAVQAAVLEEVVRLFQWTEAAFVFEEAPPPEGRFEEEQLGCAISIDPRSVVLEASRRHDAWKAIGDHVRGMDDIFVAVGPLPAEQKSGDATRLLELLDGTRDLAAVLDELPIGRFRVCRLVAQLAALGVVARASSEELRELARQAEEEGEVHRAAGFLEAALAHGEADLEAHRDLVRLYERSGRGSGLARALALLATAQETRGDLEGALEALGRATELASEDATLLARLAALTDARGDRAGHRTAARQLGRAHAAQGRHEEALAVYRDLIARDEDDDEVREALAATHIKLHEAKEAAHQLVQLGQRALARGDRDRALHYYRSVRAVDRENVEAAERIAELEADHSRTRARVRRRRITAALVSLIVGIATLQATREWMAHDALVDAMIAYRVGPQAAAIDRYAQIAKQFPLTRGGLRAEEAARTTLLDEFRHLRRLAPNAPLAAERALRRLARVRYPESMQRLWRQSRDDLVKRIAKARVSAG